MTAYVVQYNVFGNNFILIPSELALGQGILMRQLLQKLCLCMEKSAARAASSYQTGSNFFFGMRRVTRRAGCFNSGGNAMSLEQVSHVVRRQDSGRS